MIVIRTQAIQTLLDYMVTVQVLNQGDHVRAQCDNNHLYLSNKRIGEMFEPVNYTIFSGYLPLLYLYAVPAENSKETQSSFEQHAYRACCTRYLQVPGRLFEQWLYVDRHCSIQATFGTGSCRRDL